MMRICFMGTPHFAIPALERLIDSDHEVVLVVTQPDRPAGRGQQIRVSPVKELALKHHLPIEQPAKLRGTDFHQTLTALDVDVCVVVAYGMILPPEVLAAPTHGCVNIHASLLPRWRGAAPVQRSIVAGDLRTGVTIMALDAGMDTGPIILQEEIEILADDDGESVAQMLSVLGADALIRSLDACERDGGFQTTPQDDELATYAPKISKEEGRIDWSEGVEPIICRIHGMRPRPGAFSVLDGKMVQILEAEPDYSFNDSPLRPDQMPGPGMIVSHVKRLGPVVRVGDGYLVLTRVKPENKKVMDGAAWVNGGGGKVGTSFERSPETMANETAGDVAGTDA